MWASFGAIFQGWREGGWGGIRWERSVRRFGCAVGWTRRFDCRIESAARNVCWYDYVDGFVAVKQSAAIGIQYVCWLKAKGRGGERTGGFVFLRGCWLSSGRKLWFGEKQYDTVVVSASVRYVLGRLNDVAGWWRFLLLYFLEEQEEGKALLSDSRQFNNTRNWYKIHEKRKKKKKCKTNDLYQV